MTLLPAPEWPDGLSVGDEWVAAEQSAEVRFPYTGGLVAREAFLSALSSRLERVGVGDPRSEDARVSALIDDRSTARVRDWVRQALAWGGTLVNEVPGFRSVVMPYGGVTDSGAGREGTLFAIEEPTVTRPAFIRPTTRKAHP